MTDADRTLLLGDLEGAFLLLLPAAVAAEARATRAALAACRTWGDARAVLHEARVADLHDHLWGAGLPARPDDAPLEDDGLRSPPSWPAFGLEDVPGFLPDDLIERFGEAWDGPLDHGVALRPEDRDALVAALHEHGVACVEDDALQELFDDGLEPW